MTMAMHTFSFGRDPSDDPRAARRRLADSLEILAEVLHPEHVVARHRGVGWELLNAPLSVEEGPLLGMKNESEDWKK